MNSALFKASKLLLIEKKYNQYSSSKVSLFPEEFQKLLLPLANYHFRQDNDCDILSQHINAGPFSFWMHDIFAKDDIMLLPYTPTHIWALNYMYEDSLEAESRTIGNFPLQEKEVNLFNLYPGVHRVPMTGDKKILSVHVNISPEGLPDLLNRFPQLRILDKKPKMGGPVNEQPHHINPVCDFLIQKMVSCQYDGSRGYYFFQRCCADLYLNFAKQEEESHAPFLFTHLLHMDTFNDLFYYLLDNHHKGQSVAELAYTFFLTVSQLRDGFVQHFSISIEDFLYMLKMMTTYHLLNKNRLSLDDIATTAGFPDIESMKMHMEAYYDCSLQEMR